MESNNISPNNEELKASKKQSRKVRWEEGAKDNALLKDIADIESDFNTADTEVSLD
jgi:hypothetical protein